MYQSTSLLLCAALSLVNRATAAPPSWAQWNDALQASPTATLPADAAALPQPTTPLQVIALGVGRQNYTCASTVAAPAAVGAVATLFDATTFISQTQHFTDIATTNMTHYADSLSTDTYDNGLGQQIIGKHFFDTAGVPNFDLYAYGSGAYLYAKKAGVTPAPSGSYTGRDGQPAVAWLYLKDDGTGRSYGVSSVYRVETVGGAAAASCAGEVPGQVFTHDYAALYWFYR